MVYTEDPFGRIVNVHWTDDDDGGPPDFYYPCGAFKHGYALPSFFPIPGDSIFILDDFNIYAISFDDNPAHHPNKPYAYWWTTADYLPSGEVTRPMDVPYIWGPGQDWTVTVDFATLAGRVPGLTGVRIQEFRNLNIQALIHPTPAPDRIVDGPVINITHQTDAEIFPPGFRVQSMAADGLWRFVNYPPTLIQAHCEHETVGEYPPSPPGFPPGNYWFQYPAPGSTSWPAKPPPPPPFAE